MAFLQMAHPAVESHGELARLWGAFKALFYKIVKGGTYRAVPVVCAMTTVTGGHAIVTLRLMGVLFAHWAPAKLAARIFCQPSGMPLNIVLNLLFSLGVSLKPPEVLPAQDTLDDMIIKIAKDCNACLGTGSMGCVWYSRSALGSSLPLCLLPLARGIWVGSRDKACVRVVGRTWVGFVPCASVGEGVAVDPGASLHGSAKGMHPVEWIISVCVCVRACYTRNFDLFHAGMRSTLVTSAYIALFMRCDSGFLLGELSWLCMMVLVRSGVRSWELRVWESLFKAVSGPDFGWVYFRPRRHHCFRKDITYTDGSVMKTKSDSPPLVGSGVYKPNKEGDHPSPQMQLYIKPNGHGPTNTINRAELAGIL
eukprot:1141327-Pelagomonas_calceolata.AAC.1